MNILRTLFLISLPIFSIFFVLVYLLGLLNLHFSDRNNYCAMTYMYEYPQFVRLSVDENINFPGYGLYAYSEGRFTERARRMWFDGVPVLYLPGNSGSHMQARSLASVALRMSLSRETDFHFDYFTISFNEEVSGLYGGVLEKQTKFATASINTILGLYMENKYRKSVPTSVILIGHSMGGVIAKRLLAQPDSINTTNIAIALAAPLVAPVINFDEKMNNFYMMIDEEWDNNIRSKVEVKENKMLLSFGGGPRDVLVPSGLTSDNDSYISALATSIPGVWVSPDHVGIVWCKQLVMTINRFLFSIVDPVNEQIDQNMDVVMSKAKMYFESNRSMTLNPDTAHANCTMTPDAFWYEDNRRIYQISRPEIDKITYLMIRLIAFPQNRFVAIEAVNVTDKDWIFGCNAKEVFHMHRYCHSATSLSELSRWTGAATNFGKRKLATINLHSVSKMYPDWTHVVVKVSPTRKPVTLNVDVNDYASRVKIINMPAIFGSEKSVIIEQTEPESVYYEIILNRFKSVQQAYELHVEPSPECKATRYHVSAELHVPWAKNHEFYHYFTHEKKSPMKLRLFSSQPRERLIGIYEPAKITILLDPQCTFSISISLSWYYEDAQIVRYYTPVLIPYMGGILLLALRNTLINIRQHGVSLPVHLALTSRLILPYCCIPVILALSMMSRSLRCWAPFLETAGSKNLEIVENFLDWTLMLFIYMAALGILYISAAFIQAMLMFSSQITHRFIFRIVWSGAANFAERVASGLQKVPLVVSFTLMIGAPFSCGAASLVAGAAFYAFMLSKMYEEYFEDYVYNIVVKFALRMCRALVRSRGSRPCENNPTPGTEANSGDHPTPEASPISETNVTTDANPTPAVKATSESKPISESKQTSVAKPSSETPIDTINETEANEPKDQGAGGDASADETAPVVNTDNTATEKDEELKDQLNSLNFHVLLFLLWLLVAIVNLPVLMTWARNFNTDSILRMDTSNIQGMIMSACTIYLFQMRAPKKNLLCYNIVIDTILFMSIVVFVFGPVAMYLVGHVITLVFLVVTAQQMFDKPDDGVNVDSFFFDDILEPSLYFGCLKNDVELKTQENAQKLDKECRESVASSATESAGTCPSVAAASAATSSDTTSTTAPSGTSSSTASPLAASASSSATASSGPSSSVASTIHEQPANDPVQIGECDEGSIMYKIKMLKEKLSFLEQT